MKEILKSQMYRYFCSDFIRDLAFGKISGRRAERERERGRERGRERRGEKGRAGRESETARERAGEERAGKERVRGKGSKRERYICINIYIYI